MVAALAGAGHRALAIDLPSHGDDSTPVADVTLSVYADRICQAIDAESEGRVILVGHSMGGLVISQAAEYRSDRLQSLVYLTAMLPAPGDTRVEPPEVPAVQQYLTPSPDGDAVEISADGARQVFFGDCSDADIALAEDRLCPQASALFESPLELSNAKFGSVPRYYIECLKDIALAPEVQRRFYERTPCRRVYPLETSHSPFFSQPHELSKILCEIASS